MNKIHVRVIADVTLDGKISYSRGGSSKTILEFEKPQVREYAHLQRSLFDAILVGKNTIVSDNPSLTVRAIPGRNPLRVIPTATCELPAMSTILKDGNPTLIITNGNASPSRIKALSCFNHVEVAICKESNADGKIGAAGILRVLEQRKIRSLIVEGGPQTLFEFFSAGLVDELMVKHLPIICGQKDAPNLLEKSIFSGSGKFQECSLISSLALDGQVVALYRVSGSALN